MVDEEITNDVRQFIFEYIDSVEQLDVLIFLRAHRELAWSAKNISQELRSSPASIAGRCKLLKDAGFIIAIDKHPGTFQYLRMDVDKELLLEKLINSYKLRRQSVLQLIFSPLKKGRNFANAFVVLKSTKGNEDDNG